MLASITLRPVDHDHCCTLLEALAEGVVLADMIEIQAEDDDGVFPCCIKCGKFKVMIDRNEIDCARSLVERGGGNAFALVCYQVAMRRIEGGDGGSRSDVVIEHVERNGQVVKGQYRPLIRTQNRETGEDEFIDPLEGLEQMSSCGCGGTTP